MELKWSNINFVTLVLSVRHGRVLDKDKDPKTAAAIRDVDLASGMMNALKKQKALSYLAQSYVFVTEAGQHPVLEKARTEIPLPVPSTSYVRNEQHS